MDIGIITGSLEKEYHPYLPDSCEKNLFQEKAQFYDKHYICPMKEYITFGNYL